MQSLPWARNMLIQRWTHIQRRVKTWTPSWERNIQMDRWHII